jgi:hypothetical protein
MFTVEERDRVLDGILEIDRADTRIVAGAMIGSLAAGTGDQWSDLDLGFGLADGVSPADVLADWAPRLEREHDAVHLLDPPPVHYLFGLGAHDAVRARFCIERGRLWQAEYWISGVRDQALTLACRRRGLNAWHGRGYDDLPPDVLDERMLVRSVQKEDLVQALDRAIDALLREAGDARDLASKVDGWLRQL